MTRHRSVEEARQAAQAEWHLGRMHTCTYTHFMRHATKRGDVYLRCI